ncbi:MAG: porin family protein [Gemmatimonadota bacterium]|jgi:hypothetical protein
MRTSRFVFAVLPGLACLALAPHSALAQGDLTWGLRGGVSVATASLDVNETFDKSNRTGFAGGVFFDYDAGSLGFQIAAQYSQKGVELDLGDAVNEFSLDYLEIPAVVKLGLPLALIKPSVFGGAALGFNTSCDSSGSDCGDDFKKTDFSGIAGADVAIYLGSISLWADARYHFGLNNVSDTNDVVGDLKNRNWTVQGGLGFPLGG